MVKDEIKKRDKEEEIFERAEKKRQEASIIKKLKEEAEEEGEFGGPELSKMDIPKHMQYTEVEEDYDSGDESPSEIMRQHTALEKFRKHKKGRKQKKEVEQAEEHPGGEEVSSSEEDEEEEEEPQREHFKIE